MSAKQDGKVAALSHVAIATPNADALATTLVAALGAERGDEELLEPKNPTHTVARFLEKRGPGLHHVSLEVSGIEEALASCRAAGVQLIDESPRPGAHGTRVAFLHPKSLGGVLVELSERALAAPP